METKPKLRDLAMQVSAGLTIYIAVHNRIYREGAGFASVIKNLFGRATPMSKLLEDAQELVPVWDLIHTRVENFRVDYGSYLPEKEDEYLHILVRYVGSVRKTIGALVDRQTLLFEGSKGGANNAMTWQACKDKEAAYQSAVAGYKAVGQELNAASLAIFG